MAARGHRWPSSSGSRACALGASPRTGRRPPRRSRARWRDGRRPGTPTGSSSAPTAPACGGPPRCVAASTYWRCSRASSPPPSAWTGPPWSCSRGSWPPAPACCSASMRSASTAAAALWLSSLPHPPASPSGPRPGSCSRCARSPWSSRCSRAACARAGSRRPPSWRPPFGSAAACCLSVTASCMGLSVRSPHRADLQGSRDTPAPPATMAAYSVRLAALTTFTGLAFSLTAYADNPLLPLGLMVALGMLATRRLLIAAAPLRPTAGQGTGRGHRRRRLTVRHRTSSVRRRSRDRSDEVGSETPHGRSR